MFKFIIEASVKFRWFVVLATALVSAWGLFQLTKLPIDAVPDITNRQVQINTIAPALAPEQMERQVTYPLETAMAGIPGLQSTRSLSRNGFSQVTVIFTDQTDIYFVVDEPFRDSFYRAMAVLVAASPCALPERLPVRHRARRYRALLAVSPDLRLAHSLTQLSSSCYERYKHQVVDAGVCDLKSAGRKSLPVQARPPAPLCFNDLGQF